MPLVPCPECGREISTAAEACPQCGHPNRPAARPAPGPDDFGGPTCYACTSAATTRCQSCGALSCALHVNSIYVTHNQGGGYELRCESCYDSAMTWKIVGYVFAGIVIVIVLGFMASRQ